MSNKFALNTLRIASHIVPELAARYALRLFSTPRRIPYSESAKQLFTSVNRFPVAYKGRTLAVYEWGEGDEPAVLLVHGWDSNASALRAYIAPLVERGFRVVAFDAPAQGQSTGSQTNLVDNAGAIAHIIATCGPIYAIIGHSMGGAAAMTALDFHRDLGVARVVLNGSPNEVTGFVRGFARMLNLSDAALRAMIHQMEARFHYPLSHFSAKRVAAELNLPGLVIHDRGDTVVPYSDAEKIVSKWSNAKLITTEGLDHRGMLTNPEIIKQVVDFVAFEYIPA